MQQSIENYEQFVEDNRIDKALTQAEAEYNSGAKLLDAKRCFLL